MAIFDKTGQANRLTTGGPAIELFTDRHEEIRHFLAYLHDDPPRERILFFYGDGGNGKSLLLRFLRTYCCKRLRPEEWEYIRTVPLDQLEAYIKRVVGVETIPFAHLDFGMPPNGEDRPQEPFAALLMLRRQCARHHLLFPIYDYACVWYLRETGRLTPERLRNLFPAHEVDFISELVNSISGTSYATLARVALNVLNKYMGKQLAEQFTLYLQRRGLTEDTISAIQQMEAETELLETLPRLFADDLNTAMTLTGAPSRLVFFFDTHEALWGIQKRTSARDTFFQRDEWLRCLLGHLHLAQGIIPVVAGRDFPHWADASRATIPATFVDPKRIGHLSQADAMTYLEEAGVNSEAMRECLVGYAQVKPGEIHPFYLALCADIVLASAVRGVPLISEDFHTVPNLRKRATELLDRLLRYVDVHMEYAVRALSACRAFNRDIYIALGRALDFQATTTAFDVLCAFSFVWRDETRTDGWHRIHDLIRRLLHEHADATTRRAHERLEHYYRERSATGDINANIEAIYHANALEWQRGVQEWVTVFDQALSQSNYEYCRALLTIRAELTIKTDFRLGLVTESEGDFFFHLTRYEEAWQKFMEAIAAFDKALEHTPDDVGAYANKGNIFGKLGKLQADLAQYSLASQSFAQSLTAFDTALQYAPHNVFVLGSKGSTLLKLGDLQAERSQYPDAVQSYTQAIAAFEAVLSTHPHDILAHNNTGLALRCLGTVQVTCLQYEEAVQSYTQAIAALEKALEYAPNFIFAYTNKGLALDGLGRMHALLAQYPDAIQSYTQAIAAFEAALRRAPDHVAAYTNKGATLQSLGGLQKDMIVQNYGRLQAAPPQLRKSLHDSYTQAIAASDEALQRAPENIDAHTNKGLALDGLGRIYTLLAQYLDAVQSYTQAIAAFEIAFRRAPGHIAVYNNQGLTLAALAHVQTKLSQFTEATESYNRSIQAFDNALQYSTNYVFAYANKAAALQELGDVQTCLSQDSKAVQSYIQAIAASDEALQHAPGDVAVETGKATALRRLGRLQVKLAQHSEALQSYTQASRIFDGILRKARANPVTHNDGGIVYIELGDLQADLSQHEEALQNYRRAIAIFDEILRDAPDHVIAYTNKGAALQSIGNLQGKLSQYTEAMQNYLQAISAFDEALQRDPNYVNAHNNKGRAFHSLGEMQESLSQHTQAIESLDAALVAYSRSLDIAPNNAQIRELQYQLQEKLRLCRHLSM